MKVERSSGAILFKRRPSQEVVCLLLQSRKWKTWGFPKGHIEANETAETAARREIAEETGLACEIIKGFEETYSYDFDQDGVHIKKEVIYRLAEAPDQNVVLTPNEHTASKWVTFQEANALLSHDDAKKMLKCAHEFLSR
jgi:8-oxo-dGTP pyrophosphatase MutT (NUDIX family)